MWLTGPAIQGAAKHINQTGRPSNPVADGLNLSSRLKIKYSENTENSCFACLTVVFGKGLW